MAMQTRSDIKNFPFVLSGAVLSKTLTVKQNAGRVGALVFGTLVAIVAATGKVVPFTDETATDGSALPVGFYVGDDIPAASIVAGDVTDCPVLIGGAAATIDAQQVVIENSKTLNTVIGATTIHAARVEEFLARRGLFVEQTIDIAGLET